MKQVGLVLLVICLLGLAQSQNQEEQTAVTQINLNRTYSFDLQPKQTATWQIVLQDNPSNDSNLYITAQAPSNDPLQQPFMTILLGQTRIKKCLSANNQFSGICRVDGSEIDFQQKIKVTAQCITYCHLKVSAMFESAMRITTDSNLIISAPKDTAEGFQFAVQIAEQLNFTSLAFYAQIISVADGEGALQLYANTGNKNILVPTSKEYQILGQSIFLGGRGLYFDDKVFKNGRNWIKIYMALSAGMKVKIYWQKIFGDDFIVKLGQSYFDFTTKDSQKDYYLQLADNVDQIKQKTISLCFVIYAGMPKVQVAFDENFKNPINGLQSFGTMTFLLTDEVRYINHFNTTIYIRVSSTWNADYYFYTSVIEYNFMMVTKDFTYYNSLGIQSVFNYFYDTILNIDTETDENITTKRTFVIKVDMLEGQGTFGIRRCKAMEEGGDQKSCVIGAAGKAVKQKNMENFKDIPVTIKKADSYYQIIFQYDFAQCKQHKSDTSTIITYYCVFHALAINQNEPRLDYTWQIQQRTYSSTLREGQMTKQSVYQGQSIFYRFGLRQLDDVGQVAIFVTVIEGNVFMIGSTTQKYPNIDSEGSIKTSGSHRIVFKKEQIADNFYITVTGMQFSEYSIGVVVSRVQSATSNQTHSLAPIVKTKTKLQLGLTQRYTLKVSDTNAYFTIKAYEQADIVIQVIELVGKVTMDVTNPDGGTVTCLAKPTAKDAIECDLPMRKGQTVDIKITGAATTQQKFGIAYYKKQSCPLYSVNLPMYVELSAGQTSCFKYSITKTADFELVTSGALQMFLNNLLEIKVCVDEKCLYKFMSHHQPITKEQVGSLCNFNGDHKHSCSIEVQLINNGESALDFDVVLRDVAKDVVLFDGVSQKLSISSLSKDRSKKMYFDVYAQSTLRIFFTAITPDSYVILGHFVQEKQFLANQDDSYLQYSDLYSHKNTNNFYKFTKYGSGTSLLVIPVEDFKKYCKKCIFTMNVFSLIKGAPSIQSLFEIEASQQQTALSVGQTKKGYLEKDQTFVYQLTQPKTDDAIITIKDKNKESSSLRNCFFTTLDEQKWSNDETLIITKGSTNLTLFVTSASQICHYEVTYTLATSPVIQVMKNDVYSYTVPPGTTSYFLYNNNQDTSFKIVQMLNSGSTKLSLAGLKTTLDLGNYLASNPSKFQFQFDENQGEVYLYNYTKSFCSGCSYLIAVTSHEGAKGELVILSTKASVPLSVNGIIKQKIVHKQINSRRYMFQSLVDFNVSIVVIYGRVKVTITDNLRKKIMQEQVDGSRVFSVEHVQGSQSYTFDYDLAQTTFMIDIEADQDSQFTIKASRMALTDRIFAGVNKQFKIKKEEPYILQFFNLQDKSIQTGKESSINILFEAIDIPDTIQSMPNIYIKVDVIEQNSVNMIPKLVQPLNKTQSDAVISLQLPMIKGDYYIALTSDADVSINAIMVQQALIHLQPKKNVLLNRPQTFEMFSPQKSVLIEIFACSGDLFVKAVDQYKQLHGYSNSSVGDVVLQQSNMGGHYVVSAEDVSGQYFVRVDNKAIDEQFQYLLYYYYYEQSQMQPYKMVDLRSPDISYSLEQQGINFSIEPIQTKLESDSIVKSIRIDYQFYVSATKDSVRRYANCRSSNVLIQQPTIKKPTQVEFLLKNDDIHDLGEVYFVGAEAIVSLTLKDYSKRVYYPSELNLIYSVVEITNSKMPPTIAADSNYSVETVILFMLLPFCLAGLALYFALRFCIRKYRGMVPDDFVEQRPGAESEQAVNKGDSDQV